jgi:hypothetical protein
LRKVEGDLVIGLVSLTLLARGKVYAEIDKRPRKYHWHDVSSYVKAICHNPYQQINRQQPGN